MSTSRWPVRASWSGELALLIGLLSGAGLMAEPLFATPPTPTTSGLKLDPTACLGEGCDSDGDGLSDEQELAFGLDASDADSDDDGVLDGAEPEWSLDSDEDGLINALDADSDQDGLLDGT